MTSAPFLKLFFITIIAFLLLFPPPGTADCDLDNTTISLKMMNKPVKEILKKVEEQTTYTFEIRDHKALNKKKSILLNQTPLNQTFRRLLKDINYSIICNDEQKVLTLVFLDKSSRPPTGTARKTGEPPSFNTDGIATAFENYNGKNIQTTPEPQKQATSMDGVDDAFEDYKNMDKQAIPEPPRQITSMDGADDAFEDYKNMDKQAIPEPPRQITSMDGADDAFKDYKNMDRQAIPEQPRQITSMDGVDAAFEDYQRMNKK